MPMQPHIMNGFNSGIDMNMDAGFAEGWSSGIDIASDMGMDFNRPQQGALQLPMSFSFDGPSGDFANPDTLGGREDAFSNGPPRPGVHSQQAQGVSMQKAARSQAMQQRQMKLQAQQQHYREAVNAAQCQSQGSSAQQQGRGNGIPLHATEPHNGKPVSRLRNPMRHNSSVSGDEAGSPEKVFPEVAGMRNNEEEMDEDERLLASEEGKKLASKERRQLRNKVSARAFRSKRKGIFIVALHSKETLTRQNTSASLKAKLL